MVGSLSILMPVYNDGDTIERAIGEAYQVAKRVAGRFEVVVTDDGSRDTTGTILNHAQKSYQELRVITHRTNRGYGNTIKELYYAGKNTWLFTIPGDYQVGAKELLTLLPYTDSADMIIGWRRNRHDPASRLVQSAMYNSLLWLLFGVKLHDVNSIRLIRCDMMHRIKLTSNSAFVDAELAIKAKKAGFRIVEIPIIHRASVKKGRGGGGKWWTILPTMWEMVKYKFDG